MAEDPIIGYLVDAPAPAAPERGDFAKGFGVGLAGVKATGGGLLALGARAFGAKGLEQAGLDYSRETLEAVAPDTQRVEDVFKDGFDPGKGIDFAQYALGTALPSILTAIVGGGVPALGVKTLVAGATRKMIERAGIAGAGAATVGLEAGSIFPEAVETGVENPVARTIGGAALATMAELAPQVYLARRLGLLGKAAARQPGASALAREVGTEAAKVSALEAGTEATQSLIERAAAGQDLSSPEAVSEYINSAAIGGIAGGVFGGAAGLVSPVAQPQASEITQGTEQPPAPTDTRRTELETRVAALQQELAADVRRPKADILRELRPLASELSALDAVPADVSAALDETVKTARQEPPVSDVIQTRPPETDTIAAETAVAQMKRDLGLLVSSREAKLVPKVDKGAVSFEILESRTPRERIRQPAAAVRTDTVEGLSVNTVKTLMPMLLEGASGKRQTALLRRAEPALLEAAKQAATAPTLEAAQQAFEKAARPVLKKARVPDGDIDTFVQQVARDVAKAPTLFSRGARIETYDEVQANAARTEQGDSILSFQTRAQALARIPETKRDAWEPRSFRAGPKEPLRWYVMPKATADVAQPVAKESRAAQAPSPDRRQADTGGTQRTATQDRRQDLAGRVDKAVAQLQEAEAQSTAVGAQLAAAQAAGQDITPLAAEWKTARELVSKRQLDVAAARTQLEIYRTEAEQRSRAAATAAHDYRANVLAARGQEVITEMRRILGNDSALDIKFFQAEPDAPIGRYTRTGPVKSLIEVALNAKDVLSTGYHEGFHFLEDRVLSGAERQIIANALKPGKPMFETLLGRLRAYDLANKTSLADEVLSIPAEARAYGYEFWKRGELQAQGPVGRVFQKIRNLMERIVNLITGKGFQSIEDIFEAIDRGAYADRPARGGVGIAELASEAGQATWYFSALEKQVAASPSNAASPEGWKNTLKGLVNKGLVKQTELDAVGVEEWLDLRRGKVLKQELLDFIGANGVRVQDVVLGNAAALADVRENVDGTWSVYDLRTGDNIGVSSDTREGALEEAEALDKTTPGTKFASYQLPGGENYREILLTLPGPNTASLPGGTELFIDGQFFGRYATRADAERSRIGLQSNPVNAFRRFELHDTAPVQGLEAELFRSPHFDVLNPVVHIRLNERTDADGKRVGFIEEIQGEWAQQGRKDGFGNTPIPTRPGETPSYMAGVPSAPFVSSRKFGIFKENAEMAFDKMGKIVGPDEGHPRRFSTMAQAEAAAKKYSADARDLGQQADTEAWVALALKRMIRYAAENGFDRVAWTTGEQQAARYDLSKHISAITWYQSGELNAFGLTGEKVISQRATESELPDIIGKDAAKKLLESKPNKQGVHLIEGLDLKVGGESMAAFYDKIVPNVANKVLKNLGGGKVRTVQVDVPGVELSTEDHSRMTPAQRADWLRGLHQPGFDITPALREKVLGEGIPLFSRGAQLDPAAARAAMTDIKRRYEAGELQRDQLHDIVARSIQQADLSNATWQTLFQAAKAQFVDTPQEFRFRSIATPNYVSTKSKAYANVQRVFKTLEARKSVLVSRGSEEALSLWHKAAQPDITAAYKAINERSLRKHAEGSAEYAQLRGALTSQQQALFDQATVMFRDWLRLELATEEQSKSRILLPTFSKAPEAEQQFISSLVGLPKDQLPELNALQKDMLDEAKAFEKWHTARRDKVEEMIRDGYSPFRRFGEHVVYAYLSATDPKTGRAQKLVAFSEHFENAAKAQLALAEYTAQLAKDAPELKVEYGRRHNVDRDISLSLEQFLDVARRQGVQLTQAERERIVQALVTADSMRYNRIFRRENIPGFSEDGMRVMSEFVVQLANKIARTELNDAINESLDGRPVDARLVNGDPKVTIDRNKNMWADEGSQAGMFRNLADELADQMLVQDHSGTWSRKLRTGGVIYFLGGSLGVGVVQLMSLPMLTAPWLAAYTSIPNALAKVGAALTTTIANQATLRNINKLKDRDGFPMPGIDEVPGLRDGLIVAAEDGGTLDTELHQVMSMSRGDMLAQSRKVRKAMDVWMLPFRWTEQVNRITTFIAAYNVGAENKLSGREHYDFARGMINKTQNEYSAANRPAWANHPIGSLLMMFRSFPLFMIEQIEGMYRVSPKAGTFMLGTLVMLAGVNGLPFAEPLQDLIDTLAQKLFGSPFNTRRWMRNTLKDMSEFVTGLDMSSLFLNGVINDQLDTSLASRIGLGDFVPGTRIGAADNNYARTAEQLLGAPIGMLIQTLSATPDVVGGALTLDKDKFLRGLRAGGPVAFRNVIKSGEQFATGEAQDAQGRKLTEVTSLNALLQGLGLSSATVAKMYEMDQIDKQTNAFYAQVRDDFTSELVRAIRVGETAKAQEVMDSIQTWNTAYPEMPIGFSPAVVRRRIVESGMSLNERTLRNLPRQLRGTSLAGEGILGQ